MLGEELLRVDVASRLDNQGILVLKFEHWIDVGSDPIELARQGS